MSVVEVTQGEAPVVLAMPHTGTWLPEDARARLNATGEARADTDWHVERLYDGLLPSASVVRATFHRYLIDANRPPSGESLYPGRNTTGLCPLTDFDGQPLYRAGAEPEPAEIERRVAAYHGPYHAALSAELDRVRARHGSVILYDCHSIRSRIPFLFDGRLPDLNIGTNGGVSCAATMEERVAEICAKAQAYTSVLNGRFKGGWTTRAYGDPVAGRHAVQMEIAQAAYMEETPPWTWRPDLAGSLRPVLARILAALAGMAPQPGARR